MELERQIVNITVDYLETDDLLAVMDNIFIGQDIESITDPITIRFVGGALVNPTEIAIAIEFYCDLNPLIDFVIATGKPVVVTHALTDQQKTGVPITFDYDSAIPEIPDSKIKILIKHGFSNIAERFWSHKSEHIISIVKITECNEVLLDAYLYSLINKEQE